MKKILAIFISCVILIGCQTEYYKLLVSVSGNGSYNVSPEKNEYEDGETVTITAIPDSGWKFRKWEGSTLSTSNNPLQLVMDGKKDIRTIFAIPVEPNLSGTWESQQYLITFELQQIDPFETDLKGTMRVKTTLGTTLSYSISGDNLNPQVKMQCKKSGYYDVYFNGIFVDDNFIDGYLIEAGATYDCDIVRITGSSLTKDRSPLSIGRFNSVYNSERLQ